MNNLDLVFAKAEELNSYYNLNNAKLDVLENISKINILIGANNSGKSRFIRYLLNTNLIVSNIYWAQKKIKEFNCKIEGFYIYNLHKNTHIGNFDFTVFDNWNSTIKFREINNTKNVNKIFEDIDYNIRFIEFFERLNNDFTLSQLFQFSPINNSELSILKEHLYLIRDKTIIKTNKKIFIPTLRTAHSLFQQKGGEFSKISNDIYKDTIIKNFSLDKDKVDVFTGLDLYYQIVNIRNDVKDKREAFEQFEEFLSINFFQGKKIEIVAKFNIYDKHQGKDDSEIIDVYIDGESKDLHELGDGIQALFVLMYKIYTCENNSVVFIDEPEINLHPGMQRLFLEQIINNEFLKQKALIYFISTHSNHFLDLTIEKDNISIFLFNKIDKDKFIIKNVNHGDNSTLQYLGVTNSSVFLANCSIWVEGISDRNYFKAFLKAYCRDIPNKIYPKEDIEFAFIEYAGSNINHYNFDEIEFKEKINAFSINNKIFLVSDYDGEYRAEKHKVYEEIGNENKNFIYQTTKNYKEIENLLPLEIWDKILINFCDKRKIKKEKDFKIAQDQISKVLKDIEVSLYETFYIGKLLKDIKDKVPLLNEIWDKPEGTLRNKAEVSYKVLELTEKGEITWNDFKTNSKIVSIVENLYDFIQKSNYK